MGHAPKIFVLVRTLPILFKMIERFSGFSEKIKKSTLANHAVLYIDTGKIKKLYFDLV